MTNEQNKKLNSELIALGHKLLLEERESVRNHYRVHLYAGLLYGSIITNHVELQTERPYNSYIYEWPHTGGIYGWPSDVAGNKSWAGW